MPRKAYDFHRSLITFLSLLKRRRFIKESKDVKKLKKSLDAIVIGCSAGGIEALKMILEELSEKFPLPILIVQHISPDSKKRLSDFFSDICKVKVVEAEDKDQIKSGTIYFAPANYHLLVEQDRTCSLSVDDAVNHSRPSIDVLFSSAAQVYKKRLMGIILTGANNDGAEGLQDIKEFGGIIIAEDPSSARVPIMPQSAIEKVIPDMVLNLGLIKRLLLELEA